MALDTSGQLLKLDLSFTLHSKPPQILFKCPGTSISSISWSAHTHCFAVGAMDGTLTIYDGITSEKICSKLFTTGITAVKWLSQESSSWVHSTVPTLRGEEVFPPSTITLEGSEWRGVSACLPCVGVPLAGVGEAVS
ncbi:hypothetical protein LAZ67_9000822 [Cordylochernes scorpioides]|uniref:Uncharacterized protein n=1 Tax=Cordylochernes scorpioides TaxID=51811 RepID=A0ABY6KTE2_9ARAC|nr:hypothetical protein LAZ67_9000822 [Cordylochernes scorpioides]